MASWKAKIAFRHNGAAERGGQGGGVGQARCVRPAPPSSRPTLPACAPLFANAPQRGSQTPPSPSTLTPAPSPLTGHCSSRPLGDILGQAGFRAQIWKGCLGEDARTESAPPPHRARAAGTEHPCLQDRDPKEPATGSRPLWLPRDSRHFRSPELVDFRTRNRGAALCLSVCLCLPVF